MIALAHLSPEDAKAHLETGICALFGEEVILRDRNQTTKVKKLRRRIWIGGNLVQLKHTVKDRLGILWLRYLHNAIDTGILPFDNYHTAYNYVDEWWLYTHGGDEYSFENISNLTNAERYRTAHHLRGSLHSDQQADQLRAEREDNTVTLTRLIISRLTDEDLITAGDLISRGWVPTEFEERMLDAVPRQEAA